MSRDRIEELLQRALEDGQVPPEATPAERLEVERLLAAAADVSSIRRLTAQEAEATIPSARARFARTLAGQSADLPRPRAFPYRRGGWLRTAVAAVVVVGLAAFGGVLLLRGGTETAAALEPGDFLQVQGTVESTVTTADGQTLRLRTAIGPLEILVSPDTLLARDGEPRPLSDLQPGEGLLAAGVVGADRRLAAHTLALGQVEGDEPGPIERLTQLRGELRAQVHSIALSAEDGKARVVVTGPSGRRFLFTLDGPAAARLLEQGSSVPGRHVLVTRDSSGNAQVTLERPPDMPHRRPGLLEVAGVISSLGDGAFEVTTLRGVVRVEVRDSTRVVGVERQRLPAELEVGRRVTVAGTRDQDGMVVAHLVIVGRERGQAGPAR